MQTTDLAVFNAEAESLIKNELIVKIGENLQLKAAEVLEGAVLGVYLHANKKVAAVVTLSGGAEALANDLAMQVAAMMPKYLAPTDVPNEVMEKEKEIYREQLRGEGKPEAIWDKIIEGKLNKFYEETCLLNQYFIKEDKTKIADLLAAAGADVKITKFARYAV
jgi:elongation factor Ts